jgi:hypothetical protein
VVDFVKKATRVEPIRKATTLPEFARQLAQPVTTVKRLFVGGILPGNLIKRAPGKHWRVSFSDHELRECNASLVCWSVWRRKPRASKTYARRDELNYTTIRLIMGDASGKAVRVPKSGKVKGLSSKAKKAKARAKIQALWRALGKSKRNHTGAIWKQRIVASPTQKSVGEFVLFTAVMEFRKQHGRTPTQKQLADALQISESSIYRFPFGKEALRLAYSERNLAGIKDEKKAEGTDDPRQNEYDRIARKDYAQQYQRQVSDHIGEETRRELRKRKAKSYELEWKKDPVGKDAAALLIFQASKLKAKRRLEMNEQDVSLKNGKPPRKSRDDMFLRARDETFGSEAIAAYERQPDGKFHWWMNGSTREGYADSSAQARREILRSVKLAKLKFPIQNLEEAFAQVGL